MKNSGYIIKVVEVVDASVVLLIDFFVVVIVVILMLSFDVVVWISYIGTLVVTADRVEDGNVDVVVDGVVDDVVDGVVDVDDDECTIIFVGL